MPLTMSRCYRCYRNHSIPFKMAKRESDAQEYLKKHKIMELFENLTAQLIYERPGKKFKKRFLVVVRAFYCCLS